MRALTIQQPWASMVVRGAKTVENRTWQTPRRARIAVHAGLAIDTRSFAPDVSAGDLRLRGHVLGSVVIGSIHVAESAECSCDPSSGALRYSDLDLRPGRTLYHWHLEAPREYVTPWRTSGSLQLWELGPTDLGRARLADEEAAS